MNWKLRVKNKTTLISLVSLIVAIVYQTLHMLGIVPTIDEQDALDWICRIIDLLALLGIVVDPTTEGIGDSELAMSYDEPSPRTKVYVRNK